MKKIEQSFKFGENKTFFGLDVYYHGVKKSDIRKLPFYEFWEVSAVGSTCAVHEEETYVYIHDWENFCYSFILHGKHRFQADLKME